MARYLAGYARVSTDMQAERDSIVNQQEAIRAYALARNLELRLYVDAGFSAKDTDRPKMREMLQDIEAGLIETVVVVRLDRLTRSLQDLLRLHEEFMEKGVSFVSLTQSLDTSTPIGRFVFYILGLIAQMEREMTVEREMESMQARARRGKWNGGPAPFGYTCYNLEYHRWIEKVASDQGVLPEVIEVDPVMRNKADAYAIQLVGDLKRLEVHTEESELVKRIYSVFLSKKTLRSTVLHLNTAGFRTRTNVPWTLTSIKRILANPFYKGTLAYNRRMAYKKTSKARPDSEHILVEGGVPAIVDVHVWEEAQAILNQTKGLSSAQKRSTMLLGGVVHCGKCHGLMVAGATTGKNGVRYHYYRCNNSLTKGKSICVGTSIRCDQLDVSAVNTLRSFGTRTLEIKEKLKAENERYANRADPLLRREKELRKSLRAIDSRLSRLVELFELEAINIGKFNERKSALVMEKEAHEEELARILHDLAMGDDQEINVEQVLASMMNLGGVFDALDFDGQRELIRTVFKNIVVDKEGVTYNVRLLPSLFVLRNRTGSPLSPQTYFFQFP